MTAQPQGPSPFRTVEFNESTVRIEQDGQTVTYLRIVDSSKRFRFGC